MYSVEEKHTSPNNVKLISMSDVSAWKLITVN